MSQRHAWTIKKNAHRFEKGTIHTGPDSERSAQLCAYCENNLPNQAFCERTNIMFHGLQQRDQKNWQVLN